VLLVFAIWIAVVAILSLTEGRLDWDAGLWLLGIFVVVSVLSEGNWRRTNFVMLHADRIDVSKRAWGPRTKRHRWSIRYEDVRSIHVDEKKAEVFISFRQSSGLLRRFGVDESSLSVRLRSIMDAEELTERIVVERDLARQLSGPPA
jgi:hypothetical protein